MVDDVTLLHVECEQMLAYNMSGQDKTNYTQH